MHDAITAVYQLLISATDTLNKNSCYNLPEAQGCIAHNSITADITSAVKQLIKS